MSLFVNFGVNVARKAGNIILRYADQLDRLSVQQKGLNNFVSEVDKIVEEELIGMIHARFPSHRIISEEIGQVDAKEPARNTDEDYEWVIDPLNGTNNFLHGNPHFCVSLAILNKGVVEHGIIYDPMRSEMFTATKGAGTQVDSRRVRVSGQNRFSASVLQIGLLSREHPDFKTWVNNFSNIMTSGAQLRLSGSAALDLAYVAAGRADGYCQPDLKAWDCMAGNLMVRESGGFVADFSGQQNYLENGNVIAGNTIIFNELLKKVKNFSN